VPGQAVELLEGVLVEQREDALHGGLLALGVLLVDRRLPARQRRGPAPLEVGELARRAVDVGAARLVSNRTHGLCPSAGFTAYRNEVSDTMTDDPRSPLDGIALTGALTAAGLAGVRLVGTTESTNTDAAGLVLAGEPLPLLVAAEAQTAGRGRLGRHWESPPGASLLMSVAVRPGVPLSAWGWLPLLAGVSLASAVRQQAGVDARLKWPNDVVVGPADSPRKLAGVLVEGVGRGDAVIGMGVDVDQTTDELPVEWATSLRLETRGRHPRGPLLVAVVEGLLRRLGAWADAHGDHEACGLADEYRDLCVTLGQRVAASLPDGRSLEGVASGLAPGGELLITAGDGEHRVAAGDVVHLRPA